MTFEQQIAKFLEDPLHWDSYNEQIVLDKNGVMIVSQTSIGLDNVNDQNVLQVVDALELQQSILANQPINQELDNWKFFTFSGECLLIFADNVVS